MSSQIIEQRHKNYRIFVTKDLSEHVNKSWFSPTHWQQSNAIVGQSTGRNTTYFLDYMDRQMVLRRYYRGGLMAKLSRESYFFTGFHSGRASTELMMLSKMRDLDLPVPRPIAALVEKTGLVTCKNAILIERINKAQDAFQRLSERPMSAELWFGLGQMIRLFHNHGVYHSDMNIHNIMLDHNNQFWLIDFDKCAFKDPVGQWQQQTLDRLKRSLQKEKNKVAQFHFEEQDWQQLMTGYNN
jgi:3-deoxy-D-manno-octulosonic acid kinase